MPLDPRALNCAVRIIGDRENSQTLAWERGTKGTGFFVTVPSEAYPDEVRYLYLLTAHHVIDAQTDVEIEIPNPWIEGFTSDKIPVTGWEPPLEGIDLAVAAFPGPPSGLMAIAFQDFLKKPDQLFPGSLIYYIGIFESWKRTMARSGRIGARDQVNLPHKGGYRHVAHLVDCRSYKGFSGSPCFAELSFAGLTPTPERPEQIPEEIGPVGDIHSVWGLFT